MLFMKDACRIIDIYKIIETMFIDFYINLYKVNLMIFIIYLFLSRWASSKTKRVEVKRVEVRLKK